ncbi:MAG TPA: C1 family peptidase [Flavipsychrobacter sp.]|nr:C1 family peptidase [Flavipsychrobacter sp.]
MKRIFIAALAFLPFSVMAQDDLIKKIESNKSEEAKKKFVFTPLVNVECTDVKNQASSGTCWSYSTNSFLESEMIRMGKKPVDIAEIYTARCVYSDKADAYVRMHGKVEWGDGGACHDVINMYRKYGAIPQSVYSGLQYGTSKNKFAEMQGMLKAMLDVVVKNPNGKLTTSWKKAFNGVLDAYLGKVPKTFEYKGVEYTPRSFADEVIGINPDDYVELSSFTDQPYYRQTMLMVPDNWSFDKVYNIKMNDMTDIIDYALSKGYSIAWATDVSEKSFSWKNGVAYVPEKDWEDMSEEEQKNIFDGPKTERKITASMRQEAFDNYTTTDDHGMHIVGLAKDQNGREYYMVKNSWGEKNDYKGFLYVTKAYVRYKTTAFLLHKKGIPKQMREELGLD